jgi:PAS domain S-box-containing protein
VVLILRILAAWPIRKKLLLVLLVIFLPASAIIVAGGLEHRQNQIKEAQGRALLLVQSLAAQQEHIATGTEQMLSTLAQLPEMQNLDAVACDKVFREVLHRHPFYSTISATTPSGRVFAAAMPFEPGSLDVSDRKHIKDAITTLDFSAGEYIIGRLTKVPSINYAFPVIDANKNLVAIVNASFRLDQYTNFMTRANLPEGCSMSILDHRGVRLYRLPESDAATPGTLISKQAIDIASGDRNEGFFEMSGDDGIYRIYAFKQLRLRESLPPYLYMIIGIPKYDIIKKANMEMAGNLSILAMAAFTALSLSWIFWNYALIKPIGLLVAATRRFGNGEMGTRTGLRHTTDELGHLAKSFDEMASLLEIRNIERRNAEGSLNRAYSELEERVRERTAELSDANAALREEISEHKKADDSLCESEKRYRSLFENMLEGFAYCRMIFEDGKPRDFVYLATNEAFGNLTGLKDVIGKKVTEVVPGIEESNPEMFEVYGRVSLTGRQERYEDYFEPLKAWLSISIYSVEREHFVAVFENITERKHAEQEKDKLEARLRQAQKMEAIGTLAGGIAHDFNNILTPIIGYAELALLGIPEGQALRNDLLQIHKAGQRAKDLVKQILSFSRQTEQEKKPVRIGPIMKEALKLLRASLPTTIEVRQDVAPDAACSTVIADPTQIHQIIMNLCTNSAYAMRENGGILAISLESIIVDPEFTAVHRDLEPGPHLRLTVSDSGCGMTDTVKQRIFEPYYTTKGKGEGTGLGLATVYGITRSCNGAISLYSEPGKGTTFQIFLPATQEAAIDCDNVFIAKAEGKGRVLLVDDEETIVEMEQKMLERLGYEAVAKSHSGEALDIFRAEPEKFDLIITDQTMPHMTGAILAQHILKIRPDIPIILCTGFSERINDEQAKDIGIRCFLMKPIVMSQLAKSIEEARGIRQLEHKVGDESTTLPA